MSDVTRVFISHATEDSSFAERLAASLPDAIIHVSSGAARADADEQAPSSEIAELETYNALVLLLSPAAVASERIAAEMAAGIDLYKRGLLRAPVVMLAAPTPEADVPPLWTAYPWIDATSDETAAISQVLKALDLTPQQTAAPLPWTPYLETPAVTMIDQTLTRPSKPGLQQANTPSTPPPWTPYPGSTPLADATEQESRLTQPVWGKRSRGRPAGWQLAEILAVGAPIGLFILLVFLQHRELVEGLRLLAIASVVVAVMGAVVLSVALALKRAGRLSVSLWAAVLLVAILAGGIGGGYIFPSRVHTAEAHFFESRHQWWSAIHEYKLAGEQEGSFAPDIARVHNEWGAALLNQRDYAGAVDQFNQARASSRAGDGNDTYAAKSLLQAYSDWMQTGQTNVPYQDAIAFFRNYLWNGACDTTCESTAKNAEAEALYQYGSLLTQQGDPGDAVAQFERLQQDYPASPYTLQSHNVAASAYYSLGKQERGSDCQAAIPTYKTLADHYADTPQGVIAKADLAAPVDVTGFLVHYPTNPTPTASLSKNAYAPIEYYAPSGSYYFSDDYTTSVDALTGAFTFTNVPQGSYTLSANWNGLTAWWGNATANQLNFFQVGPLCTAVLGSYDSSFLH